MYIENHVLRGLSSQDMMQEELIIPEGVLKIDLNSNRDWWSETLSVNGEPRNIGYEFVDDDGKLKTAKSIELWHNSYRMDQLPLKRIKLPSTLQEICENAFRGWPIKEVVIPDSVERIGEQAFLGSDLQSVTLSPKTKTISEYCFASTHLQHVIIPEGVEEIKNGAFENISALKWISLPKTVKSVGSYAFARDRKHSEDESVPSIIKPIKYGPSKEDKIYGLRNDRNSYFWGSLVDIEEYAPLHRGKVLTANNVPNRNKREKISVEGYDSIGEFAFAECTNLKELSLAEGTKKIGIGAFAFCNGLKKIKLPQSLREIHKDAFIGCSEIEEIVIPEGVKIIGDSAFQDCEQVQKIILPNGLEVISNDLARGCSSLVSVNMPAKLTEIGDSAFEGTQILGVDLPKGVKTVGDSAFKGTKISTVAFPKGMTSVGQKCFEDCTELVDVSINNKITTIPLQCFKGCTSINTIKIPTSVQEMQDEAFANCENLRTVIYEGDGAKVHRSVSCFVDCPTSALSLDAKDDITTVIDGETYDVIAPERKITLDGIKKFLRGRDKGER